MNHQIRGSENQNALVYHQLALPLVSSVVNDVDNSINRYY
jgi:hypothetical protein